MSLDGDYTGERGSRVRNKIGLFFMILGAALFFGALGLFLYNEVQAVRAEQLSADVLHELVGQISEIHTENAENQPLEMTEVTIDGYNYIGYLLVPELELELPIMADWDYKRLKIAPCRYQGTVNGENLVLMAHNYERHFGKLSELMEGSQVIFTDMDGFSTFYEVTAKDVLVPTAVNEVTDSDFDLVLFTCTYGGKSRITIYCNKK